MNGSSNYEQNCSYKIWLYAGISEYLLVLFIHMNSKNPKVQTISRKGIVLVLISIVGLLLFYPFFKIQVEACKICPAFSIKKLSLFQVIINKLK